MSEFISFFAGASLCAFMLGCAPETIKGAEALLLIQECEKNLTRNQACIIVAKPKTLGDL